MLKEQFIRDCRGTYMEKLDIYHKFVEDSFPFLAPCCREWYLYNRPFDDWTLREQLKKRHEKNRRRALVCLGVLVSLFLLGGLALGYYLL